MLRGSCLNLKYYNSNRNSKDSQFEVPSFDGAGRQSCLQSEQSKIKLSCRICWGEGKTTL